MVRDAILPVLFLLICISLFSKDADGFANKISTRSRVRQPIANNIKRQRKIPLVVLNIVGDLFEDITARVEETEEEELVVDSKGNEFSIGSVVRVSKENLRMFQVGSKSPGYFDDDKSFVADPNLRYLQLPVGLRGTVVKVYRNKESRLSANLPIRVKFRPGELNTEEGYDSPVPFIAHFALDEVECIVG